MIFAIIKVDYKTSLQFFLYAHLCTSLSRFRIGLPVCDNVFKQLKCHSIFNLQVIRSAGNRKRNFQGPASNLIATSAARSEAPEVPKLCATRRN